MEPHTFWSGGEDGFVRQFDTRVRCVVLIRIRVSCLLMRHDSYMLPVVPIMHAWAAQHAWSPVLVPRNAM